MFVWDIDPVAFSVGPVTLRWYGLLFSGGFVLGYFIMQAMFKRARYNTEDLDRMLFYVFLGTIIGARLGHCLIYDPSYYLAHPVDILKIWQGGLASHGGTVGVILAFTLFIRRSKGRYRFFEIADMIVVPIALVCTFIRIGNFMNSEILGIPTDSPFGVVFARLGEDFARYPAQLMEALAYYMTFILLLSLYIMWKKRPEGMLLAILLFCIFTARLLIEPLKIEQAEYSTHMALNVGQLLSLPFIAGSIVLMVYLFRRDRKMRAQGISPDQLRSDAADIAASDSDSSKS